MASNLVVSRGGVEYVPPISLAFWRWFFVFLILLPFTYLTIFKNIKHLKKEYKKLFFLGGLATTLTRSMMIGFYDVLPVYIFMGIAIGMMLYEAYIETK